MWRSVTGPELTDWLRDHRCEGGYPLADYGRVVEQLTVRCLTGAGWTPGTPLGVREHAIIDGVAVAAADAVRGLRSTQGQVLTAYDRLVAARHRASER